jgi:formylmethanofuran dehydrogenase subunit E
MGLCGASTLSLTVPRTDKRLVVFVETDGCGANGVSVATGCWVGRRTLRLFDFGKLAATFVDTHTGQAVRVAPQPGIREVARRYAPEARNRWAAQHEGYRLMPTAELLSTQSVTLTVDLDALISRSGVRKACEVCAEEIMNEREVIYEGTVLCRACAGAAYYRPAPNDAPAYLPRHINQVHQLLVLA